MQCEAVAYGERFERTACLFEDFGDGERPLSCSGLDASGACGICGGETGILFSGDGAPPMQNRFYASREDACAASTIGVSFEACSVCSHIFIRKTKSELFDSTYNNDQSASGVSVRHLQNVAQALAQSAPARDSKIIEIGCGRGELLRVLSEMGYDHLEGYDPAAPMGALSFVRSEYWNPEAGAAADLVILRHTLEEIPDNDAFLRMTANALRVGGEVYVEITNAAHILKNNDVFSLFPECSNLFSLDSLTRVLVSHGLSPVRSIEYFNGAYVGVWAKRTGASSAPAPVYLANRLREIIKGLPKPVALWGIGGRGGNVLAFLRADETLIPLVVDMNVAKQGRFVPPYGQKIMSKAELDASQPGSIIVSSQRYFAEIAQQAPAGCFVVSIEDLIAQALSEKS